ncbi:MAG: hypothetical protein LUD17_06290 [Bacteroidales bacterium]|nr:hypothetical protein [Bacteroidales bacterium]
MKDRNDGMLAMLYVISYALILAVLIACLSGCRSQTVAEAGTASATASVRIDTCMVEMWRTDSVIIKEKVVVTEAGDTSRSDRETVKVRLVRDSVYICRTDTLRVERRETVEVNRLTDAQRWQIRAFWAMLAVALMICLWKSRNAIKRAAEWLAEALRKK